jgi:glycosyltransferase involved in cell wall biosynthesis
VPVYKTEKYLSECIDSVLDQTFKDYEIVLVDDGSPDKCPQICDYYAFKYTNIVCIHKKNGGLSDARNTGIINAKGEWLFLLDSDDKLYNEDTLANLSETIKKKEEIIIFCPTMMYFKENSCEYRNDFPKNINVCSPVLLYKLCAKSKVRFCAPLFITRRYFVLENTLFFEQGILHEDIEWIPRILSLVTRVGIHHMPYYFYRQNENSIMHNFNEKNACDLMVIIESYTNSNNIYTSSCGTNNRNFVSYWLATAFFSLVLDVLPNIQYIRLSNTFKYRIMAMSKILLHGYGCRNIILYLYLKIFKLDITVYTMKLLKTVREKYVKRYTS